MRRIFPGIAELNEFAARLFVETAAKSMRDRGEFSVALAGGSTPRGLYELLASDAFRHLVDWHRVNFFFGDERSVPPDHKDSNYRMAKETLFDPLGIHESVIFRWNSENLDPFEAATQYSKTLHDELDIDRGFPRFDLVLLGMGADGHTASLFPHTPALHELQKFAVANPVEKLKTTRLTLTFPVINNARNVVFLIAGREKSTVLWEVLDGARIPELLPSQSIKPTHGRLFWLLDENVAELLTNNGN